MQCVAASMIVRVKLISYDFCVLAMHVVYGMY
jgi:hypothetical protein